MTVLAGLAGDEHYVEALHALRVVLRLPKRGLKPGKSACPGLKIGSASRDGPRSGHSPIADDAGLLG